MHVVACVRISFLVEAKSYFIVWTDRICLTIHLSMDIWIASSFWLLEIMLLWTWVYKYLFQDLAFSSFGWAGLLNRKIPGNKCRRNCKYSKPPFLQPWMMYVSDDHRWPLRLLGERNFLLGESQWMSQTDAPWTHWPILMRRERDIHTDTGPTGCCAVTRLMGRDTDTDREPMRCYVSSGELTPPRKSVHISRQVIHRDYRAQRSPLSHTWKAAHQLGSWETLADK